MESVHLIWLQFHTTEKHSKVIKSKINRKQFSAYLLAYCYLLPENKGPMMKQLDESEYLFTLLFKQN